MSTGVVMVLVGVLAWLALAAATPWLLHNPRGDVVTGLAWRLIRMYVRLVHRVRVEGLENVPRWRPAEPAVGPLVVVANHTAGVDPLLIQACCEFEVKWMMMTEMMPPWSAGLWAWVGVIPVGGSVSGSRSLREAIRHLEEGGVIGVFPEGGIERPARTILPFEPGVGLLIHKTRARVLQVVIEDTPYAEHAYQSLFRRSRARVKFLPIREFRESKQGPKEIVQDLADRLVQETGWRRSGA